MIFHCAIKQTTFIDFCPESHWLNHRFNFTESYFLKQQNKIQISSCFLTLVSILEGIVQTLKKTRVALESNGRKFVSLEELFKKFLMNNRSEYCQHLCRRISVFILKHDYEEIAKDSVQLKPKLPHGKLPY